LALQQHLLQLLLLQLLLLLQRHLMYLLLGLQRRLLQLQLLRRHAILQLLLLLLLGPYLPMLHSTSRLLHLLLHGYTWNPRHHPSSRTHHCL
jgi:hypothetical protein